MLSGSSMTEDDKLVDRIAEQVIQRIPELLLDIIQKVADAAAGREDRLLREPDQLPEPRPAGEHVRPAPAPEQPIPVSQPSQASQPLEPPAAPQEAARAPEPPQVVQVEPIASRGESEPPVASEPVRIPEPQIVAPQAPSTVGAQQEYLVSQMDESGVSAWDRLQERRAKRLGRPPIVAPDPEDMVDVEPLGKPSNLPEPLPNLPIDLPDASEVVDGRRTSVPGRLPGPAVEVPLEFNVSETPIVAGPMASVDLAEAEVLQQAPIDVQVQEPSPAAPPRDTLVRDEEPSDPLNFETAQLAPYGVLPLDTNSLRPVEDFGKNDFELIFPELADLEPLPEKPIVVEPPKFVWKPEPAEPIEEIPGQRPIEIPESGGYDAIALPEPQVAATETSERPADLPMPELARASVPEPQPYEDRGPIPRFVPAELDWRNPDYTGEEDIAVRQENLPNLYQDEVLATSYELNDNMREFSESMRDVLQQLSDGLHEAKRDIRALYAFNMRRDY